MSTWEIFAHWILYSRPIHHLLFEKICFYIYTSFTVHFFQQIWHTMGTCILLQPYRTVRVEKQCWWSPRRARARCSHSEFSPAVTYLSLWEPTLTVIHTCHPSPHSRRHIPKLNTCDIEWHVHLKTFAVPGEWRCQHWRLRTRSRCSCAERLLKAHTSVIENADWAWYDTDFSSFSAFTHPFPKTYVI